MHPGQTGVTVLITKNDMEAITLQAIKLPTKTGTIADRVIRAFLAHVKAVYGIDLQMETEEMKDERLEREAKELRKRNSKRGKLGNRKSRPSTDDF